jgi:hypothetical protein
LLGSSVLYHCTNVSHRKSFPKHSFDVEKFMEKKYAAEKSVKRYETILREKDGLEKAVKYSGKVPREKRFYGKT